MSQDNDRNSPGSKVNFDPFQEKVRMDNYPFIPPGIFAFVGAFLFFIGHRAQ
jgi:hypothetical protein